MKDNTLINELYMMSLIFIRISAIFLSAQTLIGRIPITVRVIFVLVISTFIYLNTTEKPTVPDSTFNLMTSVGLEILLGITLSFGIISLMSALSFVGRALDLQIGFGAANIIDPTTNNSEALLATIFTTLAITLFFIFDMHTKFIFAISQSLSLVPFGQGPSNLSIESLIFYLGSQYLLGLSLILPTVIGLLSLDLVIAYTSKSMPQMNIYFVSLPLKIGVGIFLLFATIASTGPIFANMFKKLEDFWFSTLGASYV